MTARIESLTNLEKDDPQVHELVPNIELELSDSDIVKEVVSQGITTNSMLAMSDLLGYLLWTSYTFERSI